MNEFELIAKITKYAPKRGEDLRCGVGDDCAVIAGPGNKDWLVTQDALIEGVHFRREWTDMATLGRKTLSVNLSDIAAMGGMPRFYLVSLGMPKDLKSKCAEQIYAGMHERAQEYGAGLIGGDTVRSLAGLVLSITVIGEIPKGGGLFRCGARAGDAIFVTGIVGGAALGLSCLNAGISDGDAACFINRHKDPKPRVAAGKILAESKMVSAMIDVSDGVFADLGHIADASGVGFRIQLADLPVDEGFRSLARKIGADPSELAVAGGEDYELLFTSRPGFVDKLESKTFAKFKGLCATRIGVIAREKDKREVIDADGKFFVPAVGGFDHFN
ncbi:MAG: thiamine-phosphate kinase [Pseudomonadota bacterium]